MSMDFPFPAKRWEKHEWDQIKNLTKKEIISLLNKDARWANRGANGGRFIFHNSKFSPPYEYLAIHYHPTEGYRDKGLLKEILNHWCCSSEDLRKWKVIR
jgi:hypothetical protein